MEEITWTIIMVIYGIFVVFGTKMIFEFMISRNMEKNVAIYYNRKILHMFCGGFIGMLAPFVLDKPIYALYI